MKKNNIVICLSFLLITHQINSQPFTLGIENLKHNNTLNNTKQFGLITNHTGKDQQGVRTLDVLLKNNIRISCVLAPEHGFSGDIPAGQTVQTNYDNTTNIPIFSLYKNGNGKTVDKNIYDSIDGFIFDIQEAGMRHYTYLSTLLYTMYAACEHNKLFIVLDRPNILGNRIEGPLLSVDVAEKKSFIAAAHIPLRHGMTIGELATYFNNHVLNKPLQLTVIKMQGYKRQTALPSKFSYNLSPNIINKQSCYGYSFLGLLGEIRPFDVGIGTSHPFATIGLPSDIINTAQWQKLRNQLQQAGIHTTACNYIHERKKTKYSGLRLHINAIEQVHAFEILLTLLNFFKNNNITYTFSPNFDHASGTNLIREYIEGNVARNVLTNTVNKELKKFWIEAQDSFLYKPWPLITIMH